MVWFALITECILSNLGRDYTCFAGDPEIILPTEVDPSTAIRSPTIARFSLNCELKGVIRPSARYSWMKDGVAVVTNVLRRVLNKYPLEDDFYMLGNNSLLLLLIPQSPITIDIDLRVRVDLSLDPAIWNVTGILTMFPEGTTVEDLRRLILDAVLGNWTCVAENSFGSDSGTSIVSGKALSTWCKSCLAHPWF